jgi:hypothetical protein
MQCASRTVKNTSSEYTFAVSLEIRLDRAAPLGFARGALSQLPILFFKDLYLSMSHLAARTIRTIKD